MRLTKATGMKRKVCASCFEYPENCIGCQWYNCQECGKKLAERETYEYRGAYSCSDCFEKVQEDRERERQEVMEETEKAVRSQADGEWYNGGYKDMDTTIDGRPKPKKVKEPQRLKEYENKI